MVTVKILGAGCENCRKVESLARQAAASMGIEAQLIKVTSQREIAAYKVLMTPGLVINERLVSAGRIPTEAEVTTWIVNALEAD